MKGGAPEWEIHGIKVHHQIQPKSPPGASDQIAMSRGRDHGENPRRGIGRQRSEALIRSIEELSHRHGRRLSRWMTTWDAVDCSLLNRMILQAGETRSASRIIPTSIPLLNQIQQQSERDITSAIERVEHLIVMCNQASPDNGQEDPNQ
ncbi:MAG: hypothetical protein P8K80_00905 [Phycisphaerales bacterium]|jgi:hypothetical protein|nr:hypothetical protein [Phycisphaerales bacterium]